MSEKNGHRTIKTAEVIFREDLYPRIETSAVTVQKYAEDLDVLPPIEVNQHNELIDGWHRWTAHKKNAVETIRATVTETKSDAEFLELAIVRNASHGLQLSQQDKRDMARQIYHATPERERQAKKERLQQILSVGRSTIAEWLSRIDKDAKDATDKRIFDAWLRCETNAAIAERENLTEEAVRLKTQKFPDLEKLGKSQQADANHATDFDLPIYNIWKQQEKTSGSGIFGNSEVRWLDNLLYLYTKPFDVVIDPFAGGGTTIDLCKKRFRRYYVSDRKPIVEREKDIRQHDLISITFDKVGANISANIPKPPQWKDVRLVYLDPPYWIQAKGEYSKEPSDLANMSIEEFNESLSKIINGFAKKLTGDSRTQDAYIALIIQPTQWKAPERQFTDHVGDILRAIKLPVDMRFSVPYESQQCNAQMVEWAKENKKCLVLTREIVVWRVE